RRASDPQCDGGVGGGRCRFAGGGRAAVRTPSALHDLPRRRHRSDGVPADAHGRLTGGHRRPQCSTPRRHIIQTGSPMHVVHSPLHARHAGGVELHRGELVPSFEAPDRIDHILRALQAADAPILLPRDFAIECLHTVHDPAFVGFLQTAYARWQEEGRGGSMLPSGFPARSLRRDRVPEGVNGAMGYYAFDAGTPIVEGTWEAAFASARCALTAANLVADGARAAYALCRPPGHHAARSVYGGYCYLNNAALAAQALRDAG